MIIIPGDFDIDSTGNILYASEEEKVLYSIFRVSLKRQRKL